VLQTGENSIRTVRARLLPQPPPPEA